MPIILVMRSQTKILPVRLRKPVAELGNRLSKARAARQISQQLMAERCGVSRNTISKLENGDASICMDTLFRVLSVLGMGADIDRLVEVDKVGYDLALAKRSSKPQINAGMKQPLNTSTTVRKVPTFDGSK
jgi:transcriptional regulator with XRE-family HTH domain